MQMATHSTNTLSVLVIDDDDVDREKITRLLHATNYNINIAEGSTTADALQLMRDRVFNCAILDYHLNDGVGSELISAIQQHQQAPTPIIMISGNTDERIVADVMRDGVFDYLPKRNLQPAQLQKTLDESLDWAENERQVKEQRTRFYQLAEGLPHLVWTCGPDGNYDFLNRRWSEFTGVEPENQLGFSWIEQVHPDDREQLLNTWKHCIATEENFYYKFRIRAQSGDYHWFDTRATPLRDKNGKLIRWLGSNTDINDFELTRQALARSEQRFHAAFDYAPLGMALIDLNGNILQTNSSLDELLGYSKNTDSPHDSLVGLNVKQLSTKDDALYEQEQLARLTIEDIPFVQYETHYLSYDGRNISVLISAAFINKYQESPCYLFQIHDLSERKRHEQELIKLAHYDPLTGLGNRAKLHQDIAFLIQKSNRSAAPFAVIFGDLDHFKQINDGLGHEAGDQLLKIVARRLFKGLRKEDTVARLGGDEFVILLHDVNKFESVVTVATKLLQKINKPVRLGDNRVHIGMSFGIALYPTDGDNAKTLLRNADSALYDAKAKGRGCYQLYRKELTEYVHNRLLLDADLRRAVNNNEFELYYQPVISLDTQQVVSVEALIRWNHPVRGLVPPNDFIPYAQESGLINPIGEWVIEEACRQAYIWQTEGHDIAVAINVSARQFQQHNLVELVQTALKKYSLEPHKLIIEITEQMFLENTEDNLRQISELKELGIKISLDDFGTGYSSLSYIVRFSPNYLKIDRSFVSKIGVAQEHDEMVSAIIGLSKISPMQIIAEGVETDEQKTYLATHHCDLVQGYLYARPLRFEQLISYLEDATHNHTSTKH